MGLLARIAARASVRPVAVTADLRTELLRLVPDERRVSDGDSVREQHSTDFSYPPSQRPAVVVFP